MANLALFKSLAGKLISKPDTTSSHGAPAYALSPRHALAQYAVTGCLNRTFYATAQQQLDQVLALCEGLEPEFIAQTAVYTREKGFMKDMPALLCAVLTTRDAVLFSKTFDRVIDNGKMLRTFVQIMRSGAIGRKSLGTAPRRKVRQWLEAHDEKALFDASVGQSPSMADILKMVHPKPGTPAREAMYGYLIGRKHDATLLPPTVRQFEAYKAGETQALPDVPFQMLTALNLGTEEWRTIAGNAPWHMTRMNLNTFERNGIFYQRPDTVQMVADRLRDANLVSRARVFPYQLMTAFLNADPEMPPAILEALQDAMEHSLKNVPRLEAKVFICPDVSGSMASPITGERKGSSSKVRCIDVAALMAAAIMRQNPMAEVLPFENKVVDIRLNPRDSVMTNARALAAIGGGGTACSAPLARLNKQKAIGGLVVIISDNESWADAGGTRGTAMMQEWQVFKARNPMARLVCIDVQPNQHTQAIEREDILNVGGFSDQVFTAVSEFAAGRMSPEHWVGKIAAVTLNV